MALKKGLEELLLLVLPTQPFYSTRFYGTDFRLCGPLASAAANSGVLHLLSRDMEDHRTRLRDTAAHPQPSVNITDTVRILLLSARVVQAILELAQPELIAGVVDSHVVEHICSLRLKVAERPWSWKAAALDATLFGCLRLASRALPWRSLLSAATSSNPHSPPTRDSGPTPPSLLTQTSPASSAAAEPEWTRQIWGMLSHHTVQCYLGWWLAASMMTLRPGSPDLGMDVNLLVACRTSWEQAHEDPELRGLQSPLASAAACWAYACLAELAAVAAGPRLAAPVSPPAGKGGGSAEAGPGRAREGRVDAATGSSPFAAARAGAPGERPGKLPYTPQAMYDMMLPAASYCLEHVDAAAPSGGGGGGCGSGGGGLVPIAGRFAPTLVTVACSMAAVLQRMTEAQTTTRLPSFWQLLVRVMTLDSGSSLPYVMRDLALPAGLVFRMRIRLRSPSGASPPPALQQAPQRGPQGLPGRGGRTAAGLWQAGEGFIGVHSDWMGDQRELRAQGDGTGSPARETRQTPNANPSYPLHSAIAAGLVPALEGALRASFATSSTYASAYSTAPAWTGKAAPFQPSAASSWSPARSSGSIATGPSGGGAAPLAGEWGPSAARGASDGGIFLGRHSEPLHDSPVGTQVAPAPAAPTAAMAVTVPLACACGALDTMLRRPGVWAALLAHAPRQQVGALILTLRKIAQTAAGASAAVEAAQAEAQADGREAEGPAGTDGASPVAIEPWVMLQLQLLALLEQTAPLLAHPQSVLAAAAATTGINGGTAASVGSTHILGPLAINATSPRSSPRSSSTRSTPRSKLHPRNPRGDRAARPPHPGFDLGLGLNRDLDGLVGAGPDPAWAHVVEAGGCPQDGSLARKQFDGMAVLAAAEWLPPLLTRREAAGGQRAAPAPLTALAAANGAVLSGPRVAWECQLLLGRQCLLTRGRASHTSWMMCLRRYLAMDQVVAVLRGAAAAALPVPESSPPPSLHGSVRRGPASPRGASGGVPDSTTPRGLAQIPPATNVITPSSPAEGMATAAAMTPPPAAVAAAAVATHIMPLALDVLEVLVAAAPGSVATALSDNLRARRALALAESLSIGPQSPTSFGRGPPVAGALSAPPPPLPVPLPTAAAVATAGRRPSLASSSPLPPVWGPGLAMDAAVLSILVRHGRQGLIQCLGELGLVTRREDYFSFQPTRLGASVWGAEGGGGGAGSDAGGGGGGVSGFGELGPGGLSLPPDPSRAISELRFVVCGNPECGVLDGGSEAVLMARSYSRAGSSGGGAGGGARGSGGAGAEAWVLDRYCCLLCRQAAERVVGIRGDPST